jgi:glycosyltransferase involved in cell wall biosynthesis
MRVLLVEPYYGGSHRAWADGYRSHSRHELHLVTHPEEAWRWRLRGGSLSLAEDISRVSRQVGRPDVVLVSDLVDLPALLGFARHAVGDAPVALYMHESQLLYAAGRDDRADHRTALVNWLSLAAADLVLFNSADHRSRLFDALPGFLEQATDDRHLARLDAVAARSEVLPVGVDLSALSPDRRPPADGGPPLVVWNHRWEWDKQVDVALRLLNGLAARQIDFRVALAGQQPERLAPEIRDLVADLGDRVVHEGHLSRDAYVDLLLRGDVVVSTAIQEFFGISVVEAVAAGCVPVLPYDLSYPEIVPEDWHRAALHERTDLAPAAHLEAVLTDLPAARAAVEGLAGAMRRFDWSVVAPAYDDRLEGLRATGH